ncbi:MAG: hypothetical protein IPO01_17200 [Chitinophagaceae bacterium]|nr:hypothetical protein [Chitinophagaceae bacterium]MBK9486848.1 hypothetical protein [Chitinophagaceae bacterium]MBL0202593.1 hypothetical protein [Chitinophagaceae bacterium]
MSLNYTSICHYCGVIFKSNKSTATYCCKQHNSLYHANGSNIDYTILNSQDMNVSYYEVLSNLYKNIGSFQTWTRACSHVELEDEFYYLGPLPKSNELLLVSGFLIKKQYRPRAINGYYHFKPMQYLTKHEKASGIIITPEIYILIGDQ